MAILGHYYSVEAIPMRFRSFLSFFITLTLTLSVAQLATAQSGSSQRNTGSSGSSALSPGGDGIYYVDEIGIRIATESTPFEGFVDENEYIIGAQDVISIEAHGTIPITWRGMVVNAEGYLVIPTVGNVRIGDLSLAQAKSRITELVVQRIRTDKVTVTLEMPKPVIIHVVGDLSSPGRYTFPAHSRLDHAVINLLVGFTLTQEADSDEPVLQRRSYTVSSRPIGLPFSQDGAPFDLTQFNLRNMVIKHRDGSETNADLLAYLNGGVMKSNPYLRDGDVIMVRRTDRLSAKISMSGAVKSAFTSDFRNDDTVQYLLNVAGGYDIEADTSHFFVARLIDGAIERIRVDGSPTSNDTFILHPNDRVIVPRRTERSMDNQSVWISGEISAPGSYPIQDNATSLYEVVQVAGNITERALQAGVFIERSEITDFYKSFGWSEQQLLERTGDQFLESLDYIRQERTLNTRFIFVDLRDEAKARQIILKDGDRIHVPNDNKSILVMGQANKTGYYPVTPGFTPADYIQMAGGYAYGAQTDRTFIIKAGSREWYKPGVVPIESGDIIFIDRVPVDQFQAKRSHDLQKRQLRLTTYQIAFSTVTTLVSVVLTYIALSKQ
jgi:polysaccharide biosynthesis/export protein